MRDWQRYARALDMRLAGARLDDIASHFGVSRERARQMVILAKAQLAYRVFKGIPRPLPRPSWEPRSSVQRWAEDLPAE
jgi:hypothetical protein